MEKVHETPHRGTRFDAAGWEAARNAPTGRHSIECLPLGVKLQLAAGPAGGGIVPGRAAPQV
jgi:hypothetical protein